MSKSYSVWVSGVEVNDYLLDHETALHLAEEFREDGYDEVQIEEVTA